MKSTTVFFMAVVIVTGADAKADVFSAKPTLLSPEEGPTIVPALRLSSKKAWDLQKSGEASYRYAGYDFKSTVSTKAKHNDEPTTLDAKAGFHHSFDKVPPPKETFGQRNTTAEQGATGQNAKTFKWGSISPEFAVGFEGDESMDNRQWVYGGKINYTPSDDRGPDQWWTPYFWVEYRRIDEIGSKVAEKLKIPRQEYWRFGSQVFWQIPLSSWFGNDTPLGHMTLVPGLQYYNSTDRELGLNGSDLADAYQYSFAIEYNIPKTVSWSRKVPGFRVQVADGRVPPATENRTTISIAVTVKWGSVFK